jgi:phosphoglycerate dehydrogenase-like enzyme
MRINPQTMEGSMKVLIGRTPGLAKALPDLQKEFPEVQFESSMTAPDITVAIANADAYVGMLTRDLFLAAKKLKWIQASSTGVDFYTSIPELVAGDVRLTNARGVHTSCVAESAMAMILAITRGVAGSVKAQQKHRWAFSELRGEMVELTGSTFGLIGLGAIGRAIAKRAHAFDARVVAVDLASLDKPPYVAELWGTEHLDELLRISDYVIVTVPKTPQTVGMIGTKQIALMKTSAMLVAISRGGIIDETALVPALRDKRIAWAALDVVNSEPLTEDSGLWDLDNLLLCPHIAGSTQYADQYLLAIFRENLDRFVHGRFPLLNEVDKQAGY